MSSLRSLVSYSLGLVSATKNRGLHGLLQAVKIPPGAVFKGRDENGNEYYEMPNQIFGMGNRMVMYHKLWYDDASTVPPEWHRWLHHNDEHAPTDLPPSEPFYKLTYKSIPLSNQGIENCHQPPGFFFKTADNQSSTMKQKYIAPKYEKWSNSKQQ